MISASISGDEAEVEDSGEDSADGVSSESTSMSESVSVSKETSVWPPLLILSNGNRPGLLTMSVKVGVRTLLLSATIGVPHRSVDSCSITKCKELFADKRSVPLKGHAGNSRVDVYRRLV